MVSMRVEPDLIIPMRVMKISHEQMVISTAVNGGNEKETLLTYYKYGRLCARSNGWHRPKSRLKY
jgi:hypothetical protein